MKELEKENNRIEKLIESLNNGSHVLFERLNDSMLGNIIVTKNDREVSTFEWKYIQEWFLKNNIYCSIGTNYMQIDVNKADWVDNDLRKPYGIILLK